MREAMALRRAKTATERRPLMEGAQRLSCETEATFFGYLGLPVVPPAERSEEKVKELMGMLAEGGRA
jgi:hypothetical protein